jgi:opacity protein-like surface antigen
VCLEPAAQGGHEKEADMRRTQLITTAALVAACAVPATAAAHYGQNPGSSEVPDAAAGAKVDYSMNAAGGDYAPAATTQVTQDLRSPDARDAKTEPVTQVAQDLRSPDARDAKTEPVTQVAQDLRSPDARDAGLPESPTPSTVVDIRQAPASGFDWGDAGIGAAGLLAMLSIAGGLALLVSTRRRRRGSELPAH